MILRAIGVFIAMVALWWGAYPTVSQVLYDGDGELAVNGFWPFIDYKLEMPAFIATNDQQHHYVISHYTSGGGDWVQLCFLAQQPYDFTRSKMSAKLRISRDNGIEVLTINGLLNAPDRFDGLTKDERRAVSAAGYKKWDTYRGNNRKITNRDCFTVHSYPYFSPDFEWWKSYKMEVSLSNIEAELSGVQVHVRVISGWK